MASLRGFEPPTYRLGGGRSIQLSYSDILKSIFHFTCCPFPSGCISVVSFRTQLIIYHVFKFFSTFFILFLQAFSLAFSQTQKFPLEVYISLQPDRPFETPSYFRLSHHFSGRYAYVKLHFIHIELHLIKFHSCR